MLKTISQKNFLLVISSFFIVFVSIFMLYRVQISQESQIKLSRQQILQEAKAHFQSMVDTRSWNAQYGGVFVKSTNGLTPNPYLKNGTLKINDKETLIKINPAWMTRQISTISNQRGGYHYKITSLLPLNPDNKADVFETKALNFFEQNKKEKYFYNFNEKVGSFDFMGSLSVQKSCMKCHAHQGYKIGDIRGGIRVSLPLSLYNEQISLLSEKTENDYTIIVISSVLILIISIFVINMLYKRQYEIENANEILEEKVAERTYELKKVVSHEQQLKDLLKTITEVNEMLITSYSTESILKNCGNRLSINKAYPLVITGIINKDILDIVYKSNDYAHILDNDIVSLGEREDEPHLVKAIKKASSLKHPIVEKLNLNEDKFDKRKEDKNIKWFMILPLLHGFDKETYGMISVFTTNENGFNLEEMKILENMAHDISIALYSHKQRDAILKMEKEKSANYEETILAFVNIIEQRDTYTAGHTIRVAEYCALIAKQMGYSQKEIHHLEKAAILHDIGKVATPDTILLKPGKLSQLEYELIKQHSAVGADMLEKITIYKDLADIIRYHHSRYDGNGYPKTSSPDDIPMLSHILIIADAFDAMTTNRIYRARKTVDESLVELSKESKAQFHPDVVDAAIKALKDIDIFNTSQMPVSELENKRMSYFFQDRLTGLYNEDYLRILYNKKDKSFKYLTKLNFHNFTEYNKLFGWDTGSKLLSDIAYELQELYPDSKLIRYHGDDFIILHKHSLDLSLESILKNILLKDSIINVTQRSYEIDGLLTEEKFKNIEEDINNS